MNIVDAVSFFVAGVPIPQGAASAFIHGNRAIVTTTKKKGLTAWRGDIRTEAQRHITELFEGPIAVELDFIMPRPKSMAKRNRRPWNTKAPDIDKLLRASLDAMTGVVFRDDASVSQVFVRKITAAEGEQSGVRVGLWQIAGDEP